MKKKIAKMEAESSCSSIRRLMEALPLTKSEEISTVGFIGLSNLILQILDKVGPTMAVLRHDMQRNIERVEELYISDPLIYSNLEQVLKKEMDEGASRKAESCSRAVLWLTRSLDFSLALLDKLETDSAELNLQQAVEEAYEKTLKPWHGWISTAAYKIALKLIPDKETFICHLMSRGQDPGIFKEDIRKLICLLQPFIHQIYAQLRSFNLERLKST